MINEQDEMEQAEDILLQNGMLSRYEKRLVATRSTKQECERYISRMKDQAPDTEFITEGERGCYFISQIWYTPAIGSDEECSQYDYADYQECAQALGLSVVI